MVAVLDRVSVGDITAAAHAVSFLRTLLTLIAAVLYGVGWLVAKTLAWVWFVVVWCFAAVRIGWRDARGGG